MNDTDTYYMQHNPNGFLMTILHTACQYANIIITNISQLGVCL